MFTLLFTIVLSQRVTQHTRLPPSGILGMVGVHSLTTPYKWRGCFQNLNSQSPGHKAVAALQFPEDSPSISMIGMS